MKWKEKETKSKKQKQQAASQQYICQYKIQYIIPNTFTNKESIAHKDSLHNQLNSLIITLNCLGGVINHFSTLHPCLSHGIPMVVLVEHFHPTGEDWFNKNT